jgi:hypothetical protein
MGLVLAEVQPTLVPYALNVILLAFIYLYSPGSLSTLDFPP